MLTGTAERRLATVYSSQSAHSDSDSAAAAAKYNAEPDCVCFMCMYTLPDCGSAETADCLSIRYMMNIFTQIIHLNIHGNRHSR